MNLIVLSLSSVLWGAMLWAGGLLAQRYGEADGAARQVIWRLLAVLLIAPWIIAPVGIAMGMKGPAPAPIMMSAQTEAMPAWSAGDAVLTAAPSPAAEPPRPIPWEMLMIAGLAAGWAWRVVAAQLAKRALARILVGARPAGEGPARNAVQRWKQRLGLARAPELRVIAAGVSPFSYGVRRPVIAVPRDLDRRLDGESLDLVVGHECLHIARGDGWLRPIERIVADLLWFNPFAWLIRRELDFARELACDEAVLAHVTAPRAYARTLRDVASLAAGLSSEAPAAAMSLAGGGQAMVKRVKGALSYAKRRPAWSALVAASGLALLGAPVAIAQAVLAAPPPPPELIAPPVPAAPPVAETWAPAAPSLAAPTAPAVPAVPAMRAPKAPLAPLPPMHVALAAPPAPPPVGPGAKAPPAPPIPPAPKRPEPIAMFPGAVTFAGRDADGRFSVSLKQDGDDGRWKLGDKSGSGRNCTQMVSGGDSLVVKSGDRVKAGDVLMTGENVDARVTCDSITLNNPMPAAFAPLPPQPAPAPRPVPAPQPVPQIAPVPQVAPVPSIAPIPDPASIPRKPVPLSWASRPVLDKGARITSPFGRRVDPLTNKAGAWHEGVDMAAPLGTPIHTPAAGTVTFAGEKYGYDTVVEIAYADGVRMRYAHLREFAVKAGAAVKAGDVIGSVGNDEKSTGPHVHFEILEGGVSQDPEKVIGLTLIAK